MYETDEIIEKVVLIAIDTGKKMTMSTEECLLELEELAKTSGAQVVGTLIQKREKVHSGHYLGKGKLDELKDLISLTGATGIISDDELTPSQQKNMVKILDTKIMDRTMIILDIFAKNAATKEGQVQVELAQLKYNLSHLAGSVSHLSRLGGGIGTRGPGEKKLETDRRHIRDRITELSNELKLAETRRQVLREKRQKAGEIVVSLVGYTNAGKSTLMNALTNAGVLEEDKLFATLDTTTRKLMLPSGWEILFTDTVGFIQKLPHNLIKAFRATLEELNHADILVHVVDASSQAREEQMAVVHKTLKDLNCYDTPTITVFNKIDKDIVRPLPATEHENHSIALSAKTKEGTSTLLEEIETLISSFRKSISAFIPYSEGHLINLIHTNCEILIEEHQENGTFVRIFADKEIENKLKDFTTDNSSTINS